jgi:hypothetical protein
MINGASTAEEDVQASPEAHGCFRIANDFIHRKLRLVWKRRDASNVHDDDAEGAEEPMLRLSLVLPIEDGIDGCDDRLEQEADTLPTIVTGIQHTQVGILSSELTQLVLFYKHFHIKLNTPR